MVPRPSWILVLALAACGSPAEVPQPPPVQEVPEVQMSKEQLRTESHGVALVPSPIETQRALEAAGIEQKLAERITPRQLDLSKAEVDNAAVRTGVVIADMLLTVKTSTDEQLLGQLETIRVGMKQLQGGDDIDRTVADIQDRVRAKAVTRNELLGELEELSGAVIPELEFNGQERVVPLIKAGSWLEGANLVAKAVKDAGRPDAASNLLKQPGVVDYFIGYVRTEGQQKAPAGITRMLETSLVTLRGVAAKPEPLAAGDIETVIKTTNDVLALL